MQMNVLVTAIGSMSAQCVIKSLKKRGCLVVGCDIYPGDWHYETSLCDLFYQVPLATSNEYIDKLQSIVAKNDIDLIIPLTDVEVDCLNDRRDSFGKATIGLSSIEAISIARNKYSLYEFFKEDKNVPSIPSFSTNDNLSCTHFNDFPYIAKPQKGRSSEGLSSISSAQELSLILEKPNYIIQKKIVGSVFTVDVVRQANSGKTIVIPRKELLRTANGAGLTIQLSNDEKLKQLVCYIAEKLGINGCVNMEFISVNGAYYLIDLNPRFSAGIAFSVLTGNDLVDYHVSCFVGDNVIANAKEYNEIIVTKRFVESVLK